MYLCYKVVHRGKYSTTDEYMNSNYNEVCYLFYSLVQGGPLNQPAWAYNPQAAIAMQSYLYSRAAAAGQPNPLNEYMSRQNGSTSEESGSTKHNNSSEEGSSNTGETVAKSSEGSDEMR